MNLSKEAIEARKKELQAAFRAAATDAGFRVKGTTALRHRSGVQQVMRLDRSRFGPVWKINIKVRVDRPGDQGDEALKASDIGVSTDQLAQDAGCLPEYDAAFNLDLAPPEEGRAEVLNRFVPLIMEWFDEISSREAIERATRDDEYRIRMGTVTRNFFDDFNVERVSRYS